MFGYDREEWDNHEYSLKGGINTEIDFNQIMKTLKGENVKDRETDEPLTLKDVASIALFSGVPGERVTGEEKRARYRLAQKIEDVAGVAKDGKIDLCEHEFKLVKKMIGDTMVTLLAAQAWDMLDEVEAKAKEKPKDVAKPEVATKKTT